ncbi:DIS3-like exonuclease 2 [Nymphaea colorata]|nr:DIS3-like exonuclease 2 [Nymphaea colorata]
MKGNEGNDGGLMDSVAERFEEGEKEKRKKRRANRRNRQNQGGLVSSGKNSDGNEVTDGATLGEPQCGESSSAARRDMDSSLLCKPILEEIQSSDLQCGFFSSLESSDAAVNPIQLHGEGPKASDIAFISLPSMHITEERQVEIDCRSMPHQNNSAHGMCGNYSDKGYSRSCPSPISFEKFNPASPVNGFLPYQKTEAGRKYFVPYWSMQDVNKAVERGDAFRASFRVNAHYRIEAYCTIDGVPIDVLISGFAAQNRAIEGDVVAIVIDPVAAWPKLKGSPSVLANSSTEDDSFTVCETMESADEVLQGKLDPNKAAKFLTDQTSSFLKDTNSNALECSLASQVGLQVTYVSNSRRSETCLTYVNSTLGHLPHNSSAISRAANDTSQPDGAAAAVQKFAAIVRKFHFKRPTGRVVAIIDQSPRRNAVIGFLGVRQWMSFREGIKKDVLGPSSRKNNSKMCSLPREYVQLTPMDGKLPKMMVLVKTLPCCIKERLQKADITVEMELVAAKIHDWKDESFLPQAFVLHSLGKGTDIEAQKGAILFEHAIHHVDFSPESLACLPMLPWRIPSEEFEKRKDFRDLCVFTIDPSTATDLDDALSVEKLSDDIIRVGVHIADTSFFVMPDTALDAEAQLRSTSVYLLQHKVPMLPPVLSEDLGSLNPGADKLAFSITWDINRVGDILDQWIGRTIIRSCCKLSYEQAHDIIDERLDINSLSNGNSRLPELHGKFEWKDVIDSVRMLNRISMTLKERRFKDGALWLDSPKLVLLFDECGLPFDSNLHERISSHFLVEELMLLANMTTAKVISNAYPDCALLRRHPEPNSRKLKEFEAFCGKHGFELDTSSSGRLHMSLQKIQKKLENDPVLFDILVNYASKPMQLAAYFCTGQLRNRENEWTHYSLSVPFYTHFTSPLRRYPDIVVHRTLTAVLEAEEVYAAALQKKLVQSDKKCSQTVSGYFSSLHFDKKAADSKEGKGALMAAALRHKIPRTAELAGIAAYCNDRRLASRQAQDASERVYLWALLKKKEALISEARVLGLGPKFMSVYVNNVAMERRIYYDDIEGLIVDWLETTSTLILDLRKPKISHRKSNPGKSRVLEDIALIVNPSELKYEDVLAEMVDEVTVSEVGKNGLTEEAKPEYENLSSKPCETEPAVLPLTLQVLSQVPVSVHAIGGDNGPPDIAVKLYLSSYHKEA